MHDLWFYFKLQTTPPDHKFVEFDTTTGTTLRTFSERGARKRKAASNVDICDDASTICIDCD